MDIIVLGLLMIQSCTLYEIRKTIGTKFMNISSNSMGSIQAAVKKLLGKGFIDFHEHVEHGVNKKDYFITEEGKNHFKTVIASPMLYKDKNMELSKFFFMGFTDKNTWPELLDGYLQKLQEELDGLLQIRAVVALSPKLDEAYLDALRANGAAEEITMKNMADIAMFQLATLEFSIAKLQFEKQWFENFKQGLT